MIILNPKIYWIKSVHGGYIQGIKKCDRYKYSSYNGYGGAYIRGSSMELYLMGKSEVGSRVRIDIGEYFLEAFNKKRMSEQLYEILNNIMPSQIEIGDDNKLTDDSLSIIVGKYNEHQKEKLKAQREYNKKKLIRTKNYKNILLSLISDCISAENNKQRDIIYSISKKVKLDEHFLFFEVIGTLNENIWECDRDIIDSKRIGIFINTNTDIIVSKILFTMLEIKHNIAKEYASILKFKDNIIDIRNTKEVIEKNKR